MLRISDEIEYLNQLITQPPEGMVGTELFRRMYAWGVLAVFNKVNRDLETLSGQLDTAVNLDAISIDFDKYCDVNYWTCIGLRVGWKRQWGLDETSEDNGKHQTEINLLTDFLPNGEEGYHTTPDVLNSFKTAMHQLCDEERMGTRDLVYALDKGLKTLFQLLCEIQKKVKKPETHLFAKLWDEIQNTYSEEGIDRQYRDWLDDMGEPSLDELKARQKQEIFDFLRTGFFRFAQMPTGREVKNRKLVIGEDDLEVGTEIPEGFDAECAKFEKFVEWKEECILVFNYEKLGQYIYKNYKRFDKDDLYCITGFDKLMDLIHEEMAKRRPQLSKYLKRYADNQVEELLNDCKKIINAFKPCLRSGVRETILEEFLDKLLFDSNLMEEARSMLGGQSRNKYICGIVNELSNRMIFDGKYVSSDLAKVLSAELEKVKNETLLRYLKDPDNTTVALHNWTKDIIDDFREHPYTRPKAGLF